MNEELKALLGRLHAHHELYIGSPSLSRLIDFVDGYIECMRVRDGEIPKFLPYDFHAYVLDHYGLEYSFRGFADIIRFFEPSEETAFERFFELLEEAWKKVTEKENKI